MTSEMEPVQLPYYNEIHQYFLNLSNFLNITNDNNEINKDRSKSTRAQKARGKLLKLSSLQFYELCTDVSDELNRRIRESGDGMEISDDNSKDYLLPKSNYHMKRNQARQKLSNLSQLRFNDLIDDILFEIKRRDYHIKNNNNSFITQEEEGELPEPIAEPNLPQNHANILSNEVHEDLATDTTTTTTKMENTTDNVNTLDTNVSIPLPSMIQSSLIIPKKASIDWFDEDESDTKRSSSNNTDNNKSREVESDLENGDITEDFIKSNELNNPFNNQSSNVKEPQNNIINIPNKFEGPPELSHTPIDRIDTNSPSIKQTPNEDLTAPDTTNDELDRLEDEPSFFTSKEDIVTTEPSKNDIPSATSESEIEEDFTIKKENQLHTIDIPKIAPSPLKEQTNLPPPSPVSHLQNELMSLNEQLTALSIENENLKTKVSKLEIINNKKGTTNNSNKVDGNIFHNVSSKSNYIVTCLKHENIIKFITDDGIIPKSLIIKLYDIITKFYQHIDGNKQNITNPNNNNNISGPQNFGERLFELLDQFYKIVLNIIELLKKGDEKDMIIGLKSIFSHLVTTTKYFASYHHILPDIVIISTINECVFVITDAINILKVKRDDNVVNDSSSKEKSSSVNVFDRSAGIPMTPLPKINTSNNSSDVNTLENSPVKPLKIIEKVASSPLINGTYEPKPMPNPLRKPSGNVLLSLNNMVKKNSNEKIRSRTNSTASDLTPNQNHEKPVTPPVIEPKKVNTSSLVKKMSFSFSDENSSESESDDDDTNDLLLKLKQQQQGKSASSPLKNDTTNNNNTDSKDLNSKLSINPFPLHNNDSTVATASSATTNNELPFDIVPQTIETGSNLAKNISTPPVKTGFSSPSGRSPSFKPIKITKLESSSLKKVDLTSKDKENKDVTGLGITLNKDIPDSSKKEEVVKTDTKPQIRIDQPSSNLNTIENSRNEDLNKHGVATQGDLVNKIPERNQKRDLGINKTNKLNTGSINADSGLDNETGFRQTSVTKQSFEPSQEENNDDLDLNSTKEEREVPDSDHNRLISGNNSHVDDNSDSNNIKLDQHDDLNASPQALDNNDIALEDDSFQFIPLKSATDDVTKKIPEPIVEETKPREVVKSQDENEFIESESESGSEEEETESGSESEFESEDDDDEEEEEEEEEEEDDFDVDAFDIENPENTLSELLLYLEHQTVQVITTIQSLLTSIKEPKPTKGNLRGESNAINQVIRQMVGATSISMDQSRNANLKEHGSWVVQSLEDCSRRILILCELQKDGNFEILDYDNDFADKNFKQRLAGIAFDIAKCTKELVKTVEEASLKEEIEYLDSKIHKK